jgi:hypothetical protein
MVSRIYEWLFGFVNRNSKDKRKNCKHKWTTTRKGPAYSKLYEVSCTKCGERDDKAERRLTDNEQKNCRHYMKSIGYSRGSNSFSGSQCEKCGYYYIIK